MRVRVGALWPRAGHCVDWAGRRGVRLCRWPSPHLLVSRPELPVDAQESVRTRGAVSPRDFLHAVHWGLHRRRGSKKVGSAPPPPCLSSPPFVRLSPIVTLSTPRHPPPSFPFPTQPLCSVEIRRKVAILKSEGVQLTPELKLARRSQLLRTLVAPAPGPLLATGVRGNAQRVCPMCVCRCARTRARPACFPPSAFSHP
jgi:hypothetical protein